MGGTSGDLRFTMPVGPIMMMFFGATSSHNSAESCWRLRSSARAIATAAAPADRRYICPARPRSVWGLRCPFPCFLPSSRSLNARSMFPCPAGEGTIFKVVRLATTPRR
jgi:hypothetical protein